MNPKTDFFDLWEVPFASTTEKYEASLDLTKYGIGFGFLNRQRPPSTGEFNAIQGGNDFRLRWLYRNLKTYADANGITFNRDDYTALAQMFAGKAPLASPVFTGAPTAPTPAAGSSNLRLANTEFVTTALVNATGRLIKITRFTTSGTFTPQAATKTAIVRCQGGGGGGGGAAATIAYTSVGSGGGSGAYAEAYFTVAQIGASATVTVGGQGAGGVGAGTTLGGDGTFSAFGTLMNCPGGKGGGSTIGATSNNEAVFIVAPGFGGAPPIVPSGMMFGSAGACGAIGFTGAGQVLSGSGGNSMMGAGNWVSGANTNTSYDGGAAYGWGAGGSGAIVNKSSTPRNGGPGGPGILIVYEFA